MAASEPLYRTFLGRRFLLVFLQYVTSGYAGGDGIVDKKEGAQATDTFPPL